MKFFLLLLFISLTFNSLTAIAKVPAPSYFYIVVKDNNGKELKLIVKSIYTIENIKHQILGKYNILPEDQILVFRGTQLENNKTINNYRIIRDTTLNLILKKTIEKI